MGIEFSGHSHDGRIVPLRPEEMISIQSERVRVRLQLGEDLSVLTVRVAKFYGALLIRAVCPVQQSETIDIFSKVNTEVARQILVHSTTLTSAYNPLSVHAHGWHERR